MYDRKISINYDSFPNFRFKLRISENGTENYQIYLEAYSYDDLNKIIFQDTKSISKEYFENIFDDFLLLNLYKVKQDIEKNICFTDFKSFEIDINSSRLNINLSGLSSAEDYIMDRFIKFYKMFDVKITYI